MEPDNVSPKLLVKADKVFVDSNVFIGIFNEDDALHARALKIWDFLKKEDYKITVSNFVISEVITVLSQRVSKELALAFAHTMYFNERQEVEIIYSSETIELKALEYIQMISSKNVSFVDATIFAMSELYKIKKLASFDEIFQKQKTIEVFT